MLTRHFGMTVDTFEIPLALLAGGSVHQRPCKKQVFRSKGHCVPMLYQRQPVPGRGNRCVKAAPSVARADRKAPRRRNGSRK